MPPRKRKASVMDGYTNEHLKAAKHGASTRTFVSLPNEIKYLVAESLPPADLSSLCLVNRHFLSVLERALYIRDAAEGYSESLLWSAIHDRPATARKAISAGAKIDRWKAKPHPDHPARRDEAGTAKRDLMYGSRARVPLAHCDQSPLFIAAYQGHSEVVELLLASGAAPGWKTPWENYMTPASAAAAKGHVKVLKQLHDMGYDLAGDRCYHGTVLHSAVHHGRTRVVEFLVKTAGIDIAEKNGDGQTALATSISSRSITILRFLLKLTPPKDASITAALSQAIEGYNPSYAEIILDSNKVDWSCTTQSGDTLLAQTIQQDKPYFLDLLLQRGCFDLGVQSGNGLTPLMHARQTPGYRSRLLEMLLKSDKVCSAEKFAIGNRAFFENLPHANCDTLLELLLREGFAGDDHVAHFHGAALHGKHRIMLLLVTEFGVPVDSRLPTGHTALQDAYLRQQAETTTCLCELGASTVLEGSDHLPMLHHAALHGPVPMMRALLDGGVDPNQLAEGSGQTALHFACESGKPDRITALLNSGANPMLYDVDGFTPYHVAVYHDKEKLVKWLLSGRRAPDPLLQEGPTLLHEGARGGCTSIAKMLLKRKCNIEARTRRGETALHTAVAQGHLEIVQMLLSSGADTLAAANDGSTPATLAATCGNAEIRDAVQQKTVRNRSPVILDKVGPGQPSGVRSSSEGENRQLRRSSRGQGA